MKIRLFSVALLSLTVVFGLLFVISPPTLKAKGLAPTPRSFGEGASASLVASVAVTPTVVTATGSLNVTTAITTFRTMLGEPSNSSTPGQQPAGRRELTLDGVPGDPFVNTNNFPPDFFNPFNASAGYGLTRGSFFTTPGTGVRLSSNNFSDIDASYAAQFNGFTPPRTMAPVGSNVLNIHFQIAGAATPATVKGFGLVFSDVDQAGSTSLEFFSGHTSLGVFNAPVRSDANGLSFMGVQFDQSVVTHVRITAGQAALKAGVKDITDAGAFDLVVFDNFMYSEPIPLTAITPTVIRASGTLTVTNAISTFRSLLGGPDNGEATGQQTGGRREISWDTVPLTLTNVSTYPPNFFNTSSPHGLILAIPVDTFRVSDNDFNDINPTYGDQFNAFSAPKTAAPVGSNVVTVTFRVAGQNTPAAVNGFGLVFSDIDMPGSSSIELFNGNNSLGLFPAPAWSDASGLSFVSVQLKGQTVTQVRITNGQGVIGAAVNDVSSGGLLDVVIFDNLVYSEPRALAIYLPIVLK